MVSVCNWELPKIKGPKAAKRAVHTNQRPNYVLELADLLKRPLCKKTTLTYVTQRPWAAGAVSQHGLEPLRCLQELKPQRHCRRGWNTWTWGYNYSSQAVWIQRLNHDRCVRRNRDYSTDGLPQVFNLLLPQRWRWSSREDFFSLLPLSTMAKPRRAYLVHTFYCTVIKVHEYV